MRHDMLRMMVMSGVLRRATEEPRHKRVTTADAQRVSIEAKRDFPAHELAAALSKEAMCSI